MTCLRSYLDASKWAKIALTLLMVNTSMAWNSFVSATWGDGYTTGPVFVGYGLWRRCGNSETAPNCVNLLGWNLQWYRTVQAFAIMAFVCVNVCYLLMILLVFLNRCKGSKAISLWICVLSFFSALCYLVAVTVFAASFDDDFTVTGASSTSLAFGWIMTIIVALVQVLVGVFMILEARRMGAKVMDL
ncbi:uncharacterized protein LOC101851819 [Aplysia californica]|uniref:Uncharacterized protein LOC101851819 n=1 Tax=Aplysia californica TaxID=6500 RepID=A0ABM0K061_APLCA|nr:uncharacterized protein LOC101851819 [Aplysia californica]